MKPVKRWLAKWKPWVRSAKKPLPRSREEILQSRRNFLRHAGRTAATFGLMKLASCFTPRPITREESEYAKKIRLILEQKPLVTALRAGRSVKLALEEFPDSRVLESQFFKSKPGEIIIAGLNRRTDRVHPIPQRPEYRSMIHTHPLDYQMVHPLRVLMASFPSHTDATTLIKNALDAESNIRFSHVAVIDLTHGVMGYYSLHLGKKVRAIIAAPREGQDLPEGQKFWSLMVKLRDLSETMALTSKDEVVERLANRMINVYSHLSALGLGVRVSPMPGFEYRDGYFQPKK